MDSLTLFEGKGKDLSNYAAYSLKHDRELIFIESLLELCDFRDYKSPYSLVRKASILRLILLTDGGYYKLISREYSLKIKFNFKTKLCNTQKTNLINSHPCFFSINELIFDKKTQEISLDRFLNQTVISNKNPSYNKFMDLAHIEKEYSVKEIINLLANGHGGVHIEKTWKDKIYLDTVFSDETSPLNINFNSRLHDIINDISLICINAMIPLVEKINSQKEKPVELVFKAQIKTNSDSNTKTKK